MSSRDREVERAERHSETKTAVPLLELYDKRPICAACGRACSNQAERIKAREHWRKKTATKVAATSATRQPSTMKSALILAAISLLAAAVHGSVVEHKPRQQGAGDYVQNPAGTASFTSYSGCGQPGKQRESHSTRARTLSTVPP
jgi:hypothetical protein